jgi:hypothetical protein
VNDEVLVHINGWYDMLRYATHDRGSSWQPPFVSLETSQLRDIVFDHTPLAVAIYFELIGLYAAAPLLDPGMPIAGHRGRRKLTLRRAKQTLTSPAKARNQHTSSAWKSLIEAGLIYLSTVDGRSVCGPDMDLYVD